MNYAGLSSHEGFSPFPCHISVFYYILTSLSLLFFLTPDLKTLCLFRITSP